MPTVSETTFQPGQSIPYFNLPGTDGRMDAPEDFLDHEALLVVFTCNQCPFARAKFEPLNDIARAYESVAVVGINPNDTEQEPEDSYERMQELVEEGAVAYDAYLRDESQDVARAFDAVCTPDPFLFRRDEAADEFRLFYQGRIDDAVKPDEEPTQHDLREAIERLLAGRSPPEDVQPSRGCSIRWKT